MDILNKVLLLPKVAVSKLDTAGRVAVAGSPVLLAITAEE